MPDWFQTTRADPGVFCTTEPFVNSYFSANCYTVQGRDFDLQFDFGSGLRPYRPALPLSGAPVLAVASHAHIDHVSGFHEFDTRLAHAAEAEGFRCMSETATLKHLFRGEHFGPSLLRLPHPGFRLQDWDLLPAPLTGTLTGTLTEGDRIDLGNRAFTVLHLPGHSPGGIGLLDEHDGLFLSGDAIYDDELLDQFPDSSIPDYLITAARLAQLDCRLVLAGHCGAMDGQRMHEVARAYVGSKD